jgi:hypothetical protein
MIGKKGKWRQQPEMEGWKNTKIKQGKKEGLRGGMTMKRLPSKDVKRKSRKNEHFQIFKFLIFGGFHLCPLPDANALAAIHKTHKTQDASLQCRPTHTHTPSSSWELVLSGGAERDKSSASSWLSISKPQS